MGQRHQIFIITQHANMEMDKDYDGKKKTKHHVAAFHHQWLFGLTAGRMLSQFLNWADRLIKEVPYHPFESSDYFRTNPAEIFLSLYRVMPQYGYFYNATLEPYLLAADFSSGDNNDGITIIDLTGKKPKYAMMFLFEDEDDNIPSLTPLNIDTYISRYYDKSMFGHGYYENKKEELEERLKERLKERAKIKRRINKFDVLTMDEIVPHFPLFLKQLLDEEKDIVYAQLTDGEAKEKV